MKFYLKISRCFRHIIIKGYSCRGGNTISARVSSQAAKERIPFRGFASELFLKNGSYVTPGLTAGSLELVYLCFLCSLHLKVEWPVRAGGHCPGSAPLNGHLADVERTEYCFFLYTVMIYQARNKHMLMDLKSIFVPAKYGGSCL